MLLKEPLAEMFARKERGEMEDLFIIAKLICFAFGVIGIIISLIELVRFIIAKKRSLYPKDTEMTSPAVYRRMATAHRNEFFTVLALAICLIFVSFLVIN